MDFPRPFFVILLVMLCAIAGISAAQEASAASAPVTLVRVASGPYRFLERSDLSRYENGKYLGHLYREVRATISPSVVSGATQYRGNFLVLEETLRDLSQVARAVDEVVPAAFRVTADGNFQMIEDKGFPSLRGFPSFPATPVSIGQRWTARGFRAVDPRNDGKRVLVPLIAEYEYRGVEQYKGIPVHRVFAKYATRYKSSGGRGASQGFFSAASGTHDADILIRAEDGFPLLIRDRLDETFTWEDGSTTRFKGFTLTFSEGVSLMDRGAVVADLRSALNGELPEKPPKGIPEAAGSRVADASSGGTSPAGAPGTDGAERSSSGRATPTAKSTEGVSGAPKPPATAKPSSAKATGTAEASRPEDGDPVRAGPEALRTKDDFDLAPNASGLAVDETDAGVRLTVRDVRFAPDSDAILPAERGRLDIIADALKKTGTGTILVEGHTAAVGKAAGELDLSSRRAKRMVDELVARGLPADRFLYKGWGGERPIASNDTEAGRAKNRRVEITILD